MALYVPQTSTSLSDGLEFDIAHQNLCGFVMSFKKVNDYMNLVIGCFGLYLNLKCVRVSLTSQLPGSRALRSVASVNTCFLMMVVLMEIVNWKKSPDNLCYGETRVNVWLLDLFYYFLSGYHILSLLLLAKLANTLLRVEQNVSTESTALKKILAYGVILGSFAICGSASAYFEQCHLRTEHEHCTRLKSMVFSCGYVLVVGSTLVAFLILSLQLLPHITPAIVRSAGRAIVQPRQKFHESAQNIVYCSVIGILVLNTPQIMTIILSMTGITSPMNVAFSTLFKLLYTIQHSLLDILYFQIDERFNKYFRGRQPGLPNGRVTVSTIPMTQMPAPPPYSEATASAAVTDDATTMTDDAATMQTTRFG